MKTGQPLRPRQLSVFVSRQLFQSVVRQGVLRQGIQLSDRSSDLNVFFDAFLGDLIGQLLSMFFGREMQQMSVEFTLEVGNVSRERSTDRVDQLEDGKRIAQRRRSEGFVVMFLGGSISKKR